MARRSKKAGSKKTRSRRRHSPLWFRVVLLCLLVLLLLGTFLLSLDDDDQVEVPQHVEKIKVQPVIGYEEPPESSQYVELAQPIFNSEKKGIAIIMDDVGYDLKALRRILSLPFDVAISILPEAPHAVRAAELAHADGQVVMLHLPMEPNNPKYQAKMNEGFLRADMEKESILQKLEQALTRVPYVEGVNNHMGSLLTTMQKPMRWVIERCRDQGLFFVDSKTSADSVAADVAAKVGLPWAERRVFLDHRVELSALAAAWRGALACVKRHGGCIVIAHPHAETLDFLEQYVTSNDAKYIQPVTELLHR